MMSHSWWLADLYNANPAKAVSWVFWVVVSICLHELAHGYTAIKCGDDTPRVTGHMTANPFVHIPPMAWVMFALVGITWGLMPVDVSRLRRNWHEAWVAFAGPLTNLILVVILAVAGALWTALGAGKIADPLFTNMAICFRIGVGLNAVLFLFNLVPVPPLDGSRIAAVYVPAYRRFLGTQGGMIASTVGFIVLFFFLGGYIASFGASVATQSMDFLIGLFRPGTR